MNNIVDIIKPEEVDYIIKEGIIEHKDDVIQVKPNRLTYLINTFNSLCLVPDKDGKLICHATNYRNPEENKKHVLMDILKFFSKPCIEC